MPVPLVLRANGDIVCNTHTSFDKVACQEHWICCPMNRVSFIGLKRLKNHPVWWRFCEVMNILVFIIEGGMV